MTMNQMLALENKVREELPYFDGVDFLKNEDGNVLVRGVDVDVDVCPMTGYNKCHGVSFVDLFIVSSDGEILEDLYQ